jgi:hypothetical protein
MKKFVGIILVLAVLAGGGGYYFWSTYIHPTYLGTAREELDVIQVTLSPDHRVHLDLHNKNLAGSYSYFITDATGTAMALTDSSGKAIGKKVRLVNPTEEVTPPGGAETLNLVFNPTDKGKQGSTKFYYLR